MGRIGVLRKLYRARYAVKKEKFTGQPADPRFVAALGELQKNGFAMIPGFFAPEHCTLLRNEIDKVMADTDLNDLVTKIDEQPKLGWDSPEGFKVWTDRWKSDFRIVHAEKIHPAIDDYFNHADIYATGSSYIGTSLKRKFAMANRTCFQPDNAGSGGGWHRDSTYSRGFKSLVYLVDVNENNGPFQLIPKSDTLAYHLKNTPVEDKYQFTHQEILSILGGDESKIKSLTGSAGTLLLFEVNMLHRGKPINEGMRYAITNYFEF